MKKTSILLGALAVVGLASCSDDNTPALNVPASFVLNTPPTATDYYELAPGATIDLSCSQPDYGFVAATSYSVEMALTENPAEADIYALASNSPSHAAFTINQADVALGVCQLLGITDLDGWTEANLGYIPVYLRAVAQLNNNGLGLVKSNWIKLDNVKPYLAIPTPGFIYVVGSFTDWSQELSDKMRNARIYENDAAIGSKIYSGVFDVPAGTPTFRFYTELGDWDANSWGPANNHGGEAIDDGAGANNIVCAFTDGEFSDGLEKTKNSFQFPDWAGGEMTIVVDMSDEANPTVSISAGANIPVVSLYAYMVGNQTGWAAPEAPTYDDWKLVDEGATGVYTGTFTLPADMGQDVDGALFCRFYKELGGWSGPKAQWASAEDGSVNADVTPGVALPTFPGDGCFKLADAAGRSITVSLDANNNEVTFTFND